MAAAIEDDREAFGTQKQAQAAERKSWQKEQREALDEMLPKATGRWLTSPFLPCLPLSRGIKAKS